MDIVIVSESSTGRKLTEQAILSAINNTKDLGNIIVVETAMNELPYSGATTIFWANDFNYNGCLNFGAKHCNGEYIALCNNDVEFCEGWDDIARIMKENDILSASPFSFVNPHGHRHLPMSGTHYGYRIGHEVLGWCIIVHKSVLERIGGLNTDVDFWYSDNIYADQLQLAGIEHAIITDCCVNHLNYSNTLKTKSIPQQTYYTSNQKHKYIVARANLNAKR